MADVITVAAPVKSAWLSKINWIQGITLTGTFLTGVVGAFNLDPAVALKITSAVAMGGQVLTFIVRTYFTNSVTPNSVSQ